MTTGPDIWHASEHYLGQVRRSKSYMKDQGHRKKKPAKVVST